MELKGENQLDAITNRNERPEDLANKDDHKSTYKEIFSKLVKKKNCWNKGIKLKIDNDDLTYYFKNDTA